MHYVYFDIWHLEWEYGEIRTFNAYDVRSRLEEDEHDLYYTLTIL